MKVIKAQKGFTVHGLTVKDGEFVGLDMELDTMSKYIKNKDVRVSKTKLTLISSYQYLKSVFDRVFK